jgi:hypothetical protein
MALRRFAAGNAVEVSGLASEGFGMDATFFDACLAAPVLAGDTHAAVRRFDDGGGGQDGGVARVERVALRRVRPPAPCSEAELRGGASASAATQPLHVLYPPGVHTDVWLEDRWWAGVVHSKAGGGVRVLHPGAPPCVRVRALEIVNKRRCSHVARVRAGAARTRPRRGRAACAAPRYTTRSASHARIPRRS